MDELVIESMNVGRDGGRRTLVSLFIGDPARPLPAEFISFSVRVPPEMEAAPEELQAAALRRAMDVLRSQLAALVPAGREEGAGTNVVSLGLRQR